MSKPQTIDELMHHLKYENGIDIDGDEKKDQLICYGYYHGYKGYRFFNKPKCKIPYTNFDEVIAVIEYDNNLKSALYPAVMFLETAIKNIVCNTSVIGLEDNTFDAVYKERMKDNPSDSKLRFNRLQLRNAVYSRISHEYKNEKNKENQMVRHFYNRGEDVPIWGVFEIIFLSDLASYFSCLDFEFREKVLREMNILDASIDTNRQLISNILYTLKPLRNAVAHNNIVFDARFKDRNINAVVKKWAEKESGIKNISLYSLIDYIIIICCLLNRFDFNMKRAKHVFQTYKDQNKILEQSVSSEIYNMLIPPNVVEKLKGLERLIKEN